MVKLFRLKERGLSCIRKIEDSENNLEVDHLRRNQRKKTNIEIDQEAEAEIGIENLLNGY